MHDLVPVIGILGTVVGLPWIVLHYITRWKTAATLTSGDEQLLDELHRLAKRLDDRMDTVERLVAADNPEFKPNRVLPDSAVDNQPLREIERIYAEQGRGLK
ncbi:MAG: envelope stress response membrane protein PspB [Novosphingobium sp.]|nr:envelope stress response membrane protein PspB [Novosphingobium sp.]